MEKDEEHNLNHPYFCIVFAQLSDELINYRNNSQKRKATNIFQNKNHDNRRMRPGNWINENTDVEAQREFKYLIYFLQFNYFS